VPLGQPRPKGFFLLAGKSWGAMTPCQKLKESLASDGAVALAWHCWARFRLDGRFKIVRYALFGSAVSIGYTLSVVVFVELLGWRNPEFASALSFVIWTPISYIGHRDFTFLFTGHHARSAVKFAAAFIARLAASAYTVHIATMLGMHYLTGVIANWVVLPLISYLILDLWVFRRRPPAPGAIIPNLTTPKRIRYRRNPHQYD
jgi:putative flippase GtrA